MYHFKKENSKLFRLHTAPNVLFKPSIFKFLFVLEGMLLSSFIYSVLLVGITLTT